MDDSHVHNAPLFAETTQVFRCIETHDLDGLRALMAAFAYVDVDPQGQTIALAREAEWDAYMRANFAMMQALGATINHDITAFHAEVADTLGYSGVQFRQLVVVGTQRLVHHCVATIVWQRTADEWRQIRWQCAIERTQITGMGQPGTQEEEA